jgi:Ca-activated chloride channel family protein
MVFSSLSASIDSPTLKTRLRPLPLIVTLIALGFLMVAMARPQSPLSERSRLTEGIDIMLVIDVSESMRAMDFEPNRLEKAKEVVKEFIGGRVDDRIGIVIFGRETFTLCPLTQDYAALQTFVDRINFDLVNGVGTAIGMGLANAVNKLKDSEAKSKVVILLTDGENNSGKIQPITAAEIANQLGVRTYTIGIGSEGVVQMPQQTSGGGWIVTPQLSNIDTATLERIADLTEGRFFMATDGKKLEQIYDEIDALERTSLEVSESNFFEEQGHLLIIPALLLLALSILIEEGWLLSFP